MKKDISEISTYESGVVQSAAHRQTMKVKTTYLSQYDLTGMQWFVLGFVYEAGKDGIALTALKNILDTTMPFITNIVNSLEAKGYIHKTSSQSDSRVKIATLNQAYAHQVEEIELGLRDALRNELYIRDNISRDELNTYIRVLYKLARNSLSDDN
ncbi:TPA: hypothetical protein DIV49_00495 [Candidatus Saccharibacteria bacterium]|nr:hypothetical protein [Candidatus Saccharibacteria bacterium]HRJ90924.1 MarR family transcriptional regulator [Candidatus Saccharibacteria bacterium]